MDKAIVKKEDVILVNDKEIKIVQLLSEGLHCNEVAEEFGLSSRTMEVHITKLRQRFCSATIAHLVATFLRQGLIK